MNLFQTIRLTCHRLNAACLADRYIDERYDHPPYFLPRNDPAKRAHVRIWSDFVTEKMQKNLGCIRLHRGRNAVRMWFACATCWMSFFMEAQWGWNQYDILWFRCWLCCCIPFHDCVESKKSWFHNDKFPYLSRTRRNFYMLLMDQDPAAQTKAKEAFFQEQVSWFVSPTFYAGFSCCPKCSGKVSGESLRSTLNPIGFRLDHFAALVYCELLPRSAEPFPRPWARSDCFNWLRWKQRIWRCVARSDTSRTNIILICTKSCQSHAFFSPFLEHVACSNDIFKHGHLSLQDGPYFLGKEISMVDIALFPFWQRFLWVGSYYRGHQDIEDDLSTWTLERGDALCLWTFMNV